ncbi:MAG: phosphonate ABC transporter ATP-binding protein, partial [Proteobacteria bacterium]|nr:phosphonate ABC transporter ATP-binding protein [Pseudomonadota bacterium]
MFVPRIVGLRLGEVVYDGPADGLSPDVLTEIYGEEDWEATIKKDPEEVKDGGGVEESTEEHLAGLT